MNERDAILDCLFIGGSTQDVMMRMERVPQADERVQAWDYVKCCGGVSATAASAHQKLGGRTGIITAVGKDDAGAFIRQDLKEQNFRECRILESPDASSSVSLIQVDALGRRSIAHYGGCIGELTFSMLDQDLMRSSRILHLGVMEEELMLEIARFCGEQEGVLLSIDGGNLSPALAEKLLPYTDIWIPDEGTVAKTLGVSPEEACRRYQEMSGKKGFFTAVTLGDKGAVGLQGDRFFTAMPYRVPVTDTTGAGDNYHGAFLYAYGRGWELERCMEFAGIFASLTCRECGGRKGEPSLEEVMDILKERKEKQWS